MGGVQNETGYQKMRPLKKTTRRREKPQVCDTQKETGGPPKTTKSITGAATQLQDRKAKTCKTRCMTEEVCYHKRPRPPKLQSTAIKCHQRFRHKGWLWRLKVLRGVRIGPKSELSGGLAWDIEGSKEENKGWETWG